MTTRLHRCRATWFKVDGHPCWKVQKALDEQGVDYEVVAGPLRPGRREVLETLSGQRKYPVIEFEDGVVYREESAAMAARIRDGKLLEADQRPDASA
jgi:glutathione S-transferase